MFLRRAVATGSSSFAELLDPIAPLSGSDTSFDTHSLNACASGKTTPTNVRTVNTRNSTGGRRLSLGLPALLFFL